MTTETTELPHTIGPYRLEGLISEFFEITRYHFQTMPLVREKVDLVITGMASTDAYGGVVPAMLAERLQLPQVTLASAVEAIACRASSGD